MRHLFNLALNIRVAAMEHEVWLHMCHISGTRMIMTGIDGGSRGNADGGVLVGHNICDFIPLDKSAFDLAGDLLEKWCRDWMGPAYIRPLEPLEWFTRGHMLKSLARLGQRRLRQWRDVTRRGN